MATDIASRSPGTGHESPRHTGFAAISVARLDSVYLLVVTGGLAGGFAAAIGGLGGADSAAWAACAIVGLAFISASIVTGLLRGQAGVDIIALVAIAGALALGEYLAGAVISVMLASGRALEDFASARSERELTALLARAPQVAHRNVRGNIETIAADEVRTGDLLLVKSGEVVPVDGLLLADSAALDEAAITGESSVVERAPGERVSSGSVNVGRPFEFRASATAENSTYSGIVRLVREAQGSRSPSARLADRYALIFVPLTLVVAGAAWLASGDAVRGLAVVVVATPCPLILAVPIAIVSGVSRAARRGIIVKGGAAMEALAGARVLLFDKTGTLTQGRPVVSEIVDADGDPQEFLRLAASLEQVSPHVHAAAIVREARARSLTLKLPADVTEETGLGIHGKVDGHRVAIGRLEWVSPDTTAPPWVRRLRRHIVFDGQATVFVAIDGVLKAAVVLEDPMRPDAPRTLRLLRRAGIRRLVMVTGDRSEVAESVGAVVGVDRVLAERSPAEKVDVVRRERANGSTLMVGDGINDAPALAAADVGVAMGARGATASSETADVVLVVDRLERLADAIRISHRARGIALQSVLVGMGLSFAAMGFAAAGYLTPVAGAILQEGIDVAVILNALRALGGYGGVPSVSGEMSALAARFKAEHEKLLPFVTQLRTTADRIDSLDPSAALADVKRVHGDLVEYILPHEEAEEHELYPSVASVIGGDDPTGTMSRGHAEIAHLTRILGRSIDDLGNVSPDSGDIAEMRRLLYGLHAILRLHFAQEEEAYLSLADPDSTPPRTRHSA